MPHRVHLVFKVSRGAARMPFCDVCRHRLPADGGECPECLSREEALIEEALIEEASNAELPGEDCLTAELLGEGLTREQARAEMQDPRMLRLILDVGGGLEDILNDRNATEGLRLGILAKDPVILYGLYYYAKARKPKGKRGPKPDPRFRAYKFEVAKSLRAQGLTLGQIARKMYGDPKQAKLVAALLSPRKENLQPAKPRPAEAAQPMPAREGQLVKIKFKPK